MNEAADGRPIAFEHVEAVMRMIAEGTESAGIDVPGHRVQRIGPRLVLTGRPRSAVGRMGSERPVPNGWRYPLAVPGEVALPEIGWVVSAEERPAADGVDWDSSSGAAVAIVRSDMCRGSLAVRTRRPGDRFKPLGLGGQKKLQDFFVDRKVGRGERDTVPLVVDDRDRIVWVAGYTIDDQFRVTDPTQGVLILRLRRL
jgi:tRNA(Ile)-lysidine synthase